MFNVFSLVTNALWLGDDGEPMVFETGQLAAAFCKELPDMKLQPRKAAKGDDNWREREAQRIASGVYKRPDYLNLLEANSDHFLHLAEKKPGQLAYTKDAMKGAQDLQSIISLQGYIEAFRTGNDAKIAALDADYDAKRAELDADYDAKRAALDADYNAKRTALYADYYAKRAELDADYYAKCAALGADYYAKRAALGADYDAKRAALDADYDAKRAALNADYDAKRAALDADHNAKRAALAEDLSPDERREIEAEHSGQSFDDGLKFASTPEEIVAVYTNYDADCSQVAASCMRYECCDFPEGGSPQPPQHPCSVYGAGDLAIAYTVNVAGQTTARALVLAGEENLLARLRQRRRPAAPATQEARLQEVGRLLQGPTQTRRAWPARVSCASHGRRTAASSSCPTATTLNAREIKDKHHLVLGSGSIDLRRTDGWSEELSCDDDRCTCENCGDRCDEDETHMVFVSRRSTEEWCESCHDSSTFYCDYAEEYYSDDVGSVQMANGDTWSEYAFHDHGGECERTGRNYPRDDLVDVVIDDCGGTEQWGPHAVDRSTWECECSGDTISDDVSRVRVEGEDWAPHIAEREAFVSDYDGEWYRNASAGAARRRTHGRQGA